MTTMSLPTTKIANGTNDHWHVFASTSQSAGDNLVYLNFTDWSGASTASFHYLDQRPSALDTVPCQRSSTSLRKISGISSTRMTIQPIPQTRTTLTCLWIYVRLGVELAIAQLAFTSPVCGVLSYYLEAMKYPQSTSLSTFMAVGYVSIRL